MAYLLNRASGSTVYLFAHHSFGRLAHSVNTVVNAPSISRLHAIIEWDCDCWKFFDISRNGSWLNGQKLSKNERYELNVKDKLQFGGVHADVFEIVNLDPPVDFLIAADGHSGNEQSFIPLKPYNLLPDDSLPEIVVYLHSFQNRWCLESLNGNGTDTRIVTEGELIKFGDRRWRLIYNRSQEQTVSVEQEVSSLKDIGFVFQLSLDEENAQLKLRTANEELDLGERSHHYLTLTLARLKVASIEQGIDETEQGWVYADQLAKDLGLTETHLNIQIHRARKQLFESLHCNPDPESFIQRRGGKVRLGLNNFSVFKGVKLECSTAEQSLGVHF